MKIRPYGPTDEEPVVALWTSVFDYREPRNHPRYVIRSKLDVDDGLFFVACDADEILGTVMGGYDGHRGWIYALAVAPAERRRGVGSALVRHLERELTARGCVKINLQVLASNADVLSFYEHIGYAVEQRISMGKVLDGEL